MSASLRRREFLAVAAAASVMPAARGSTAAAESGRAAAGRQHPWWVDEVDAPPLAIDDRVYGRFDPSRNVFGSFARYVGPERMREIREASRAFADQCRRDNRAGHRREDRALHDAAWLLSRTGGLNRGMRSWTRPFGTRSGPREEPWTAPPERAATVVKRAARYFGAATGGIARLDRRHVFARERGLEFLVGTLAEFIRELGYVAIPGVNDLGASVAFAVDAGLGELGRTNRLITPEFGPAVRLCKVFTDMPLATDRPVRFGILEFCRVCKRCAESCPSEALSFKDDPDFEVQGEWNNWISLAVFVVSLAVWAGATAWRARGRTR